MLLLTLLCTLAADPKSAAVHVIENKSVEVRHVPIKFAHKTLDEWAASLKVQLAGNDNPLLGTHTYSDGTLKFEPRFPFAAGVTYKVLFKDGETDLTHEFTIPKPKVEAASVVTIFPTAEKLPENTLRFYVQFTKPMRRGEIYQYITLRNDTEKKLVDLPFVEFDEELWSADRKRLTLLIDPGRIKRGVKPREDLGPALIEGHTFTLSISNKWLDADGEPLKTTFAKSFSVTKTNLTPIEPTEWTLTLPTAGKTDKLSVNLGRPLDAGMLQRVVWIEDATGKKLDGTITLAKAESVWEFTPKAAWAKGDYKLVVETHLEDVSGNRVGEPFEVDLQKPREKPVLSAKTVTRAVEVK